MKHKKGSCVKIGILIYEIIVYIKNTSRLFIFMTSDFLFSKRATKKLDKEENTYYIYNQE